MTSVDDSNVDREETFNNDEDRVPTTPSSLLSRKGLFGKSAAALRDPSPTDTNNPKKEKTVNGDENDCIPSSATEKTSDDSIENDRVKEKEVNESDNVYSIPSVNNSMSVDEVTIEKTDTLPSLENSDEKDKFHNEAKVDSLENLDEDVIVKKIISVDTSNQELLIPTTVHEEGSSKTNNEDLEQKSILEKDVETKAHENKQKEEGDEEGDEEEGDGEEGDGEEGDGEEGDGEEGDGEEGDEEEDEVPKKRAKRTGPLPETENNSRPSNKNLQTQETVVSKNDIEELSEENVIDEEIDEAPVKKRGRRRKNESSETAEIKTGERRSMRGRKSEEEKTETIDKINKNTPFQPDSMQKSTNDQAIEIIGERKTPKRGRKKNSFSSEKIEDSSLSLTPDKTCEDANIEETPKTNERRSSRVRNQIVATPKSVLKTSASEKKKLRNVTISENEIKKDEDEEDDKNSNQKEVIEHVKEKSNVKKEKSARTKLTPKAEIKTLSSNKKEEYDPYDMDTEMEKHPEPLKHIHMERQNFGSVKYAKVGSGSKYEMTEKAAEARISNLTSTTPVRKERKSLAEMTPGKEKLQHRLTGIIGKEKKKGKKADDELDEYELEKNEITPGKSTNRGRKRKSETDVATPISSKKPTVSIPVLSSEEQWKVDHPEDEHEPHAPGARVYALFDKIYYPAVVVAERDGLNRFKVQFTADKIVKDVPMAGIIPIRAIVAGKECFYAEDVMNVLACPNAASADAWEKGIFELESLDESGEPTGDTVLTEWCNITLDMADWKEYIKEKSSKAAEVVTENITTPSQMCRTRKPKVETSAPGPTKKATSKNIKNLSEESSHLIMNERGIGKDVFAGKIFILTSANRQSFHNIPIAYRKKNLQEFIEHNGGLVTESFEEADSSACESILVSDTHYRTHKYLAALARAWPCVSNQWIKTCADQGECVDYTPYLLPAGVSLLYGDDRLCEAPKNPSKLLEGLRFFVHSTHNTPENTQLGPGGTFIDIWKPIIRLLGGNVLDVKANQSTDEDYDVLVTDNTYLEEVWKQADEKKVAVVTSEWIIQTIINNKAPEYDAHVKFHPNYLRKAKEERKISR